MDELTRSKVQMFSVWCGAIYTVLVFGGWAITGWIPPTPPSFSAEHVAAIYQSDLMWIRIGMIIVSFGSLFGYAYGAVWAQYVARIERGAGPLTYTMVMSGGVGLVLLTFYPTQWWLTAAFRPDRPAELIQLLNDMAWLPFIAGIAIWLPMPIVMAFVTFCDKSAEPTFPRWSGYANVFMVLTFLLDQLVYFFHSGPFGWNGLFGVYVPAADFIFIFIGVNSVVLRRAVLRDRARILESDVSEPSLIPAS